MGAGKKVWGYYPAGNVWLPLRCNALGQLEIDLALVNLGDLGDVNFGALANWDIIRRDFATGMWVDNTVPQLLAQGTLGDLGDVTIVGAARGDILRRGVAAWNNYALGAAGTYLRSGALDPAWAVPTFLELADTPAAYTANYAVRANAAGTALVFERRSWEVVADYLVPAPTQLVSFAGLDLDANRVYNVILTLDNPTIGAVTYYIFFNADYVLANYGTQIVAAAGGGALIARVAFPVCAYAYANECCFSDVLVARTNDGFPRWITRGESMRPAAIVEAAWRAGAYNQVGNVTQIDIGGSAVGSINTGSRIIILAGLP